MDVVSGRGILVLWSYFILKNILIVLDSTHSEAIFCGHDGMLGIQGPLPHGKLSQGRDQGQGLGLCQEKSPGLCQEKGLGQGLGLCQDKGQNPVQEVAAG